MYTKKELEKELKDLRETLGWVCYQIDSCQDGASLTPKVYARKDRLRERIAEVRSELKKLES